jgi:isopenicillin-N epimerase
LCAPKGVGFLWAREDKRKSVRPAVISHGANARVDLAHRYRIEFEWMGTDDPTAALTLPEALRFMGSLLPGGWASLRSRNHALVLEGRRIVAEALGVALPCPDDMIGSMASLPVPASEHFTAPSVASALEHDALHDALFRDYAIEAPVISCPAHPGRLLRVSAQAYNVSADYQRLADALREWFSPT